MTGHIVYVPSVYRYRPQSKIDTEAAALVQGTTTQAPKPEEEPVVDLDILLDRLDDELQRLDQLLSAQEQIPNHVAEVDRQSQKLEAEDFPTLKALEARSAEASKLANMRLLAISRSKKLEAAVASQREATLKAGCEAAAVLERQWWANYSRLAARNPSSVP
jgi:hypothetical protein